MKKLTALLLIAAVSAGLLAGCGRGNTKNIEKVRVWTLNSHSFGKELDFINSYNKTEGKKKGIYIDYILKAYNMYEELEKAYASGDVPEFAPWPNFATATQSGKIVAIDDLPGGGELLREHREKGLIHSPFTTFNGKVYALPIGVGTHGLIYNKDMFEKTKIVDENGKALPPKTIDEMRQYAKRLTNSKKGQYGIIFPMAWDTENAYKGENRNELWFSHDILSLTVASIGIDSYKESLGFAEVFLPYMEMVTGMRDDGSIYPGAENMTNESARAIFSGGDVGMKISSAFDVAVFNYQFLAECDWGVAPLPVLNNEKRYNQLTDYNNTTTIDATALETVTPEKLTEVLKVFVSDEYKTMLYEEGLQLPYGLDVSGIPTDGMPNGWVEFAKLSENTVEFSGGLLASSETLPQIFVNDIYLGGQNPAEAAQQCDKAVLKQWEEAERNN